MKIHLLGFYSLKICKYSFSLAIFQRDTVLTVKVENDLFLLICLLDMNKCRNLGNNIFPRLPKNGLNRVLHLKTFNNPKLRELPPPETFPRIQVYAI